MDNNFTKIGSVNVGGIDVSYGFFKDNAPSAVRVGKGISRMALISDYVVLDLETTGLMPAYDEIIEIGAVKYENDVEIARFHSLVKPINFLDDFIVELTGITDEMLEDAPKIENVLPELLTFIGDSVVVGHNANFDVNFIYDEAASKLKTIFSNDFVDTMRLARRCRLDVPNCKLNTLINHFGIAQDIEHRAIDDCIATQQLYCALKSYITTNNVDLSAPKRKKLSVTGITANCDSINSENPFFEKTVVFTGALNNMTRTQAAQLVANMGGILGDNVTKTTNYLVLGNLAYCSTIKDGKSSKQKKAEKLILSGQDLTILPENIFLSMISEE